MKKPAAIVMAVSALLTMTGCAPQLSTSDTSVELRAINSGMTSSSSPEARMQAVDDMDKLAGKASDTLKGIVTDGVFANRERLKPADEQDRAKIDETQKRIDAKADMVKDTCKL